MGEPESHRRRERDQGVARARDTSLRGRGIWDQAGLQGPLYAGDLEGRVKSEEVERHWPRCKEQAERGQTAEGKELERDGAVVCARTLSAVFTRPAVPYTHSSSKDTHSPTPSTMEEGPVLLLCDQLHGDASSSHLYISFH